MARRLRTRGGSDLLHFARVWYCMAKLVIITRFAYTRGSRYDSDQAAPSAGGHHFGGRGGLRCTRGGRVRAGESHRQSHEPGSIILRAEQLCWRDSGRKRKRSQHGWASSEPVCGDDCGGNVRARGSDGRPSAGASDGDVLQWHSCGAHAAPSGPRPVCWKAGHRSRSAGAIRYSGGSADVATTAPPSDGVQGYRGHRRPTARRDLDGGSFGLPRPTLSTATRRPPQTFRRIR